MKNITIFLTLILGTISSVQAQIPSYIPKDSLVGWWPFNGNANDESGNGNHGTVTSAVLSNDRNNNSNSSFYFDGSSNYITVPYFSHLPLSNKSRTVSVWMLPLAQADQWTLTAVAYGQGQTNNAYMFGLAKNMLAVEGWGFGYGTTLYYNDTNWIHSVCTYENDTVKIYVNSKLIGVGTIKNLDTKIGDLIFGVRVAKDLGFFKGKLDDIGIWNRALDSNEIKSIYNGTNTSANLNTNYSKSIIKYYPNPVKDILNIQGVQTNANYQITNTIGQTCMQGTIYEKLDVSALKSGVYFFKTEIGTARFVKE